MLIDGEALDTCDVISGVPQGTMLGPVLFLLFINCLPRIIMNPCKLFAHDLTVHCDITSEADVGIIQEDIDRLVDWETTWSVDFHPDKC